jgi:hypothetical protein
MRWLRNAVASIANQQEWHLLHAFGYVQKCLALLSALPQNILPLKAEEAVKLQPDISEELPGTT